MTDFGYLNVVDAKDPHWNEGRETINLEVLFERDKDSGTYLPFTASPEDIEPHGRQIFAEAKAGKYGKVADVPVLSHEVLTERAEQEKQRRLRYATNKITVWQTKLLMGRPLNDDESVQLNAWMDYIDAVTVLDISSSPDIVWPAGPDS